MNRLRIAILCSSLVLAFAGASASACPLCKESIPEAVDGNEGSHDPDRLARAYNYSIFGMLLTPAVLGTGLGLMIYRSFKKAEKKQAE